MLNNFIQLCTESFLQDSEPSHRMGSFVAILALAGAWLDLESSVCCMRLTVAARTPRSARSSRSRPTSSRTSATCSVWRRRRLTHRRGLSESSRRRHSSSSLMTSADQYVASCQLPLFGTGVFCENLSTCIWRLAFVVMDSTPIF